MLIGAASKQTGLSQKAIRLYEQQGLIRPQRIGRYRHFSAADIDLLLLIREARALGIPLQRLKAAIRYQDQQPDWTTLRTFLLQFRSEVEAEVVRQQQRLQQLDHCLHSISDCPLVPAEKI